jgi:hypothetical protein
MNQSKKVPHTLAPKTVRKRHDRRKSIAAVGARWLHLQYPVASDRSVQLWELTWSTPLSPIQNSYSKGSSRKIVCQVQLIKVKPNEPSAVWKDNYLQVSALSVQINLCNDSLRLTTEFGENVPCVPEGKHRSLFTPYPLISSVDWPSNNVTSYSFFKGISH